VISKSIKNGLSIFWQLRGFSKSNESFKNLTKTKRLKFTLLVFVKFLKFSLDFPQTPLKNFPHRIAKKKIVMTNKFHDVTFNQFRLVYNVKQKIIIIFNVAEH
jgi:hypothetical protein